MSFPYVHVTLSIHLADQAAAVLLAAEAVGLETRDESTMIAASPGEVEVIGWFDDRPTAEAAALLLRNAQSFGMTIKLFIKKGRGAP